MPCLDPFENANFTGIITKKASLYLAHFTIFCIRTEKSAERIAFNMNK